MSNLIGCDAILVGGGGGGSSEVVYARPKNCIQTVSYISGDSVDTASDIYVTNQVGQVNGLDYSATTPINTLLYNDPEFGGKVRITDDSGNDAYNDDTVRIRFDNLQGIIMDTTSRFNDTRDTLAGHIATAAAKSETINGLTYSNWYVMPLEYMVGLVSETATNRINPTLGSGVAPLLNTQRSSGVWYFPQNNLSQPVFVPTSINLPAIYFTFIEDGV